MGNAKTGLTYSTMLRLRRQTCIALAITLFTFGIIYHLKGALGITRIPYQHALSFSDNHKGTDGLSTNHTDTSPLPLIVPETPAKQSLYPTLAPRITLIAIWAPTNEPKSYLNHFFASVAENPSIDLLFVKFDKHGVGCKQPLVPSSIKDPNIRELCFEYEEYWDLHRNFLCDKKRWNCTKEERETIQEALYKRGKFDWVSTLPITIQVSLPDISLFKVNSHFRPFRSGVFAKWLNPSTPIWFVTVLNNAACFRLILA